eukprot:gene11150-3972_t
MSDHETDSGASSTYPKQAGAFKKGDYIVIKDRPCKVIDYSTSKTGKHGHAKANIVAIDLFTGKKLEDICPTSHNMNAPNVTRIDFSLMDIDEDGYLVLLDKDGEEKSDVQLPESEEGQKLRAAFDNGDNLSVCVIAAMGEEAVVSFKNEK